MYLFSEFNTIMYRDYLQTHNKQKNRPLHLMLIGEWNHDSMFPSFVLKLNADLTEIELYNGNGAQEVKGLNTDYYYTLSIYIIYNWKQLTLFFEMWDYYMRMSEGA